MSWGSRNVLLDFNLNLFYFYYFLRTQGVFYEKNGSLFFNHVDESHAGLYSCMPFNELGSDGASPLINVVVLRPPKFTIEPKSHYLLKLGTVLEMVCDARDMDGSHRPEITWTRVNLIDINRTWVNLIFDFQKDGRPLPYDRATYENGNLTIIGVIESDRGIYQCSAKNQAATIHVETEVAIENIPPYPPYNLSATSTDKTITLRWIPGK